MKLIDIVKREANYTVEGVKYTLKGVTYSLKGVKYLLKGMRYPFLGFVLFNLGLEINYFSRSRDSTILIKDNGKAVMEIPVVGKFDKKNRVKALENVLNLEYHAKPFKLSKLYINKRKDFWNKSFWDRLSEFNGAYNYSNPLTDTITLSNDSSDFSWSHEMKHNKEWEITAEHPEFKKEWTNIAKDEKGNSLYRGWLSYVKYFKKYFQTDSDETLFAEGFVSSYAKTHFWEDVAETCDSALLHPMFLIEHFYTNPQPKIIKKMKLAEKYGLIPKEFSNYLDILNSYNEALERENKFYLDPTIKDGGTRFKSDKLNDLTQKVDKFISENERSIYLPLVLILKGEIIKFNNEFATLEQQIKFYEKIFDYPVMDWELKKEILEYLNNLSGKADDRERFEEYSTMLKRYKEAYKEE